MVITKDFGIAYPYIVSVGFTISFSFVWLLQDDVLFARPANTVAMHKKTTVTADIRTHHNITPTESSFLLYNIHTDDPPHDDPSQSSHALSITLPTRTGPGIEPEKGKNVKKCQKIGYPVSILYKSIAGRYRPVRVADGPISARYRFIKNASWDR